MIRSSRLRGCLILGEGLWTATFIRAGQNHSVYSQSMLQTTGCLALGILYNSPDISQAQSPP